MTKVLSAEEHRWHKMANKRREKAAACHVCFVVYVGFVSCLAPLVSFCPSQAAKFRQNPSTRHVARAQDSDLDSLGGAAVSCCGCESIEKQRIETTKTRRRR